MLARTCLSRLGLLLSLSTACDHGDAPSAATSPTRVADGGGEAASAPAAPSPEALRVATARLQRSIELEQQGDLEAARIEAEAAAVASEGGRDATLQVAKLAILARRYEDAVGPLEALVAADPKDAAARYNLALVRHYQGDYNRARNGYLAVLKADPRYANARFNLAVLCQDHGFIDEAKHHVAKFRSSFPDDARGPDLERRVGGTGAAGPSGLPATEAPSPASPPARAP